LNQDVGKVNEPSGNTFQNLERLEIMLEKMRKNIQRTNFGEVVKFHCIGKKVSNKKSRKKKNCFDPVDKKQMFLFYRAVFRRIIPKEMFESPKVRKQLIRNVFVLVTSGKKYPILLRHLMLNLDPVHVSWLEK
jgi:hypothetical protein